ncbi:hypothetical protein ES332_D02G254800v1 [Gossypium tomentosum]|uniref:Salutaridinol 7-O-acetyltransferase n=1 Tax=Gossypium tomentosum TaxID=34277 RepID=A0A5D2M273_GOSTO|nr:hypothetical protein ES332_D02G254800v1 [Gossypium tomentosum]
MALSCFIYPSDGDVSNVSQKSESLKNSLSKILLYFYPLAGQLKDAVTIECNDEGACFIEAKSRCQLKDLLADPDTALLKSLVPSIDPKAIRSTLACNLLVQLTSFTCGGTAVAVSVSQKFADTSSFCTFIRSWTAMSGHEYGRVELPKLVGASLLPPLDTTLISIPPPTTRNCTSKRFLFHGPQITNHKPQTQSCCCHGASAAQYHRRGNRAGTHTEMRGCRCLFSWIILSVSAIRVAKRGELAEKNGSIVTRKHNRELDSEIRSDVR